MATKFDGVKHRVYHQHIPQLANDAVDDRTTVLENLYRRVLKELCANRFEWKNLPGDITNRFIETTLAQNALSVFYYDTTYNQYMSLRGSPMGALDYMDEPISYLVTGNLFINKTLSADDVVPIWANYYREPDTDIVEIYAHKLAMIDRSIEIMILNARTPVILAASENQKLSASNVMRMIYEGKAVIPVKPNFNVSDMVQSLDMGIKPDAIEKMHIVRTRLWSECMGLLGIDNANQDKKERLVAAEVDANAEQVSTMKAVNLNSRQYAARLINEKWPMPAPISVDFKKESDPFMMPQLAGLIHGEESLDGEDENYA